MSAIGAAAQASMITAARIDDSVFGDEQFSWLLERMRLTREGRPARMRRAVVLMLIAWVPLALLAIAAGEFLRKPGLGSFILDIGAHARYLVALPLLVFAGDLMIGRLSLVVMHFVDVGIVDHTQRSLFDAAIASTRRLSSSAAASGICIALSYFMVGVATRVLPVEDMPGWYISSGSGTPYSWAGWWNALVSFPLLTSMVLWHGWRWYLWVRLLWLVSRLRLLLVPAHPDGVAGLRFVSYSARAFTLHGLLLGAITAGAMANRVLYEGVSPLAFGHFAAGLVVCVLLVFVGPLAMFSGTLLDAWRRGIFEYGALAERMGRQFEAKWLHRRGELNAEALAQPDFSATTDLYSIVANAYSMRLYLFDLKSALVLVAATLLPLLPVFLIAVPVDTILARIASLLL